MVDSRGGLRVHDVVASLDTAIESTTGGGTGGAGAIPGYRVVRKIGQGGMGVVLEADQISLGRKVAIKLLIGHLSQEPDFVRRFEREAMALASLSHPGIVAVYDRGTYAGHVYFVMEFVDGPSLRTVLGMGGGKLPQARALDLALQVADALCYVHERGIVHRDVKPENVLVAGADRVKVTDFGLAGMVDRARDAALTAENTAMGTLHYLAPEQRLDARTADGRSDLYSLGVTVYEMVTGMLPLGAWVPPHQAVPGLDPRLDPLLARALRRRREDRYASMAEFRDAMAGVRATLSGPPHPGRPGSRPGPDPARKPPVDLDALVLDSGVLRAESGGVVTAGPGASDASLLASELDRLTRGIPGAGPSSVPTDPRKRPPLPLSLPPEAAPGIRVPAGAKPRSKTAPLPRTTPEANLASAPTVPQARPGSDEGTDEAPRPPPPRVRTRDR